MPQTSLAAPRRPTAHRALLTVLFAPVLALLLVQTLMPACPAQAADRVQAEGLSSIVAGDTGAARAKALDQALRAAVEKRVGVMLTSQTMVDNYALVSDKVLSESKGFVQSYDVVEEGPAQGGMYRVLVAALVESGRLTSTLENLGLLQALKGKPKVAILISEENVGQAGRPTSVSQAETTLVQAFMQKGFRVVDPAQLKRTLAADAALAAASGDDKAAAAIAAKYGAQVMVTGTAHSSPGGAIAGTSLKSVQAVVSARVVEADTARIITSGSTRAAKAHIHPVTGGSLAIEAASRKLADQLMDGIVAAWQQDVYGASAQVTLLVTGLDSYLDLDTVMVYLESGVQGVKDVQERSFGGGTAELGLDYAGNARTLARDLARHDFGTFRLDPTSVSANKIACEMQRK